MSSKFIPDISASTVAAVIGLNPYRAPYEAMYSILKKDKNLKEKIYTLERTHNRVALDVVRRKISNNSDVRAIVQRGLSETATNSDIVGIVDRAKSSIECLAAMRYPGLPASVRATIVKECASDIHKQRGLKNENEVLDQYEVLTKTEVSERNTCMRYANCGTYTLCGRIDGYVKSLNRIVDSKERTVVWPDVPIYDEIQLRVYMELMQCPEAELIERFPSGQRRNTVFTRDPDRWSTIHGALCKAADEMTRAAHDDALLLKIVEANTFTDVDRPTSNAGIPSPDHFIR